METSRTFSHVAMLLRISREKAGENVETLANHRQELTDFCNDNKWTWEEFGEVISGGKSDLEDRKELQRLLDNIEKFDAVLCMELSRISRNGLISQTVKQYCVDYDKPIITPTHTYDLANNENDRLMYDFGATISSHEHSTIGKRSKLNKMQMAKQGLHISGGIPYGYRRNPDTKKLEIFEEEAKVVRYIFQLHNKGLGSHKIRDILNAEGYKPARSEHFNLPSIKRIIRNPHYKGWTEFNDRKRYKKNGKVKYKIVKTIIIKDTHEAIIPPSEWDIANREREIRAERMRQIKERPIIKSEVTMLKDLLFCAVCGWKMVIRRDTKDGTDYTVKTCESLTSEGKRCPNCGIRVSYLEEEVWKLVNKYREDLLSYLALIQSDGTAQLKKEQEQKINQANKRLSEVEIQQKNLIDLALTGIFTNEELRDKKQELINQEKLLKDEINLLQKEIDVPDVEDVSERVNDVIKIIDELPNLTPEKVNESLKMFVKAIYYERCIPEELMKKSTRNPERRFYPAKLNIEYYQL